MSNTPAPTAVYRTDYAPSAFLIDTVELVFDLLPEQTTVTNTMRVRRNPASGLAATASPLRLMGEQLELVSIRLDGQPRDDVQVDPFGLTLKSVPQAFTLTVTTICQPAANTSLMGLYLSRGNFFTQCEAEGFRKITYFLDRPDVMASYTVTLRADQAAYPVLLSNGNLVDTGDLPDGRHYARWHDPFRKPSYLFALIAGRLVALEQKISSASGAEKLLQIWVEPHDLGKIRHAMDALIHAIRWDEQRFGLELDLERFMLVAVSDFNMGAMENKGLNIFNAKYVLADAETATDADYMNIEAVVGHEYFHNWTGNRVTCRDWFQLSLKEGLTVFREQEFSADMASVAGDDNVGLSHRCAGGVAPPCRTHVLSASARLASTAVRESCNNDSSNGSAGDGMIGSRATKRIDDVRMLRQIQFSEDAGPMAHPVRPESYVEINNFYTTTVYEKGAEVIRMMQTLLGRDGFRKGMDLYFARHDGQAVTCDDFRQAMADANGRDLTQFERWYSQAGTPHIEVRTAYNAAHNKYTLTLMQHYGESSPVAAVTQQGPLLIPFAFGLVDPSGADLPLRLADEATAQGTTRVLELTEREQTFTFIDVPAEPLPSLLRNFSAPVIVNYDYTDEQLAFLFAHDSDPFNRWEAGQRLASRALLALAADAAAGRPLGLNERIIAAFGAVLRNPQLAPAFREQALTLPSETYLAEQMAEAEPAAVHAARRYFRQRLAQVLAADWQMAYKTNHVTGPYRPIPADAGRRALRNLALAYLAELDPASAACQAAPLAQAQYEAADNMTDRSAALAVLIQLGGQSARAALDDFYRRFEHEALAIDKWFSLQATQRGQPGERVLDTVCRLIQHPAFQPKNPNRARSLIFGFCFSNPAQFHLPDGSGYEFWANQVLALDAFNPQVAARLARALERWRKFTPALRERMRAALERVAASAQSKDVREIVTKALT